MRAAENAAKPRRGYASSPPPLTQTQGVATGRGAIGAAAGAARGRRYFHVDGRGGRSLTHCPEYPKTIPWWPSIPQVAKCAEGGGVALPLGALQ